MEQIATIAQSALQAAHQATDRLMRQMLTIADTSASVERRIEEARQQTEERDKASFARRVAVLIEALKSTADRKSGVWGKSVAVRVDLGGCRFPKHNNKQTSLI